MKKLTKGEKKAIIDFVYDLKSYLAQNARILENATEDEKNPKELMVYTADVLRTMVPKIINILLDNLEIPHDE